MGCSKLIRLVKSLGSITTEIVDYVVHQMPEKTYLDPKPLLIVSNGQQEIIFKSREIDFINSQIVANRFVINQTHEILQTKQVIPTTLDQIQTQTQTSVHILHEQTQQVKIQLNLDQVLQQIECTHLNLFWNSILRN